LEEYGIIGKDTLFKMFEAAAKMVLHSWSWFGIFNFKGCLIDQVVLKEKSE
jgi:hypothetical protein